MRPLKDTVKEICKLKGLNHMDLAKKMKLLPSELQTRVDSFNWKNKKKTDEQKQFLKDLCSAMKVPKEYLLFKSLEFSDVKKQDLFKSLQGPINVVLDDTLKKR